MEHDFYPHLTVEATIPINCAVNAVCGDPGLPPVLGSTLPSRGINGG